MLFRSLKEKGDLLRTMIFLSLTSDQIKKPFDWDKIRSQKLGLHMKITVIDKFGKVLVTAPQQQEDDLGHYLLRRYVLDSTGNQGFERDWLARPGAAKIVLSVSRPLEVNK